MRKKYESVFSKNIIEVRDILKHSETPKSIICFTFELRTQVDELITKVTLSKEDSIDLAKQILNVYTNELLGG